MDWLRRVLSRHEVGLVVAIVLAVALATVLDPQHNYWFRAEENARNILRQASLLGIFAVGSAVVIIAGGIDLSSGAVIAFSGSLCGSIMLCLAPEKSLAGEPVGAGVIAAAVTGTLFVAVLIGFLHAWLITTVRLPPFVATLATLVGLRSAGRAMVEAVTTRIQHTRSTEIQIADMEFRDWTRSVAVQSVVFAVVAVSIWLLLRWTVTGRHVYALGGNEQAARLSGIRTTRLKYLAYSLSAMCAALAGVLYIGDQAVADPYSLGRGYELNAIAAAVVGGCSLQGGAGTIPGTILGALFLRVVIDSIPQVIKSNADTYEGLIVGGVVVAAVAFTQWRARRGG